MNDVNLTPLRTDEVEAKQRIVVGVNRYEAQKKAPIELLRLDPALETKRVERVQATRVKRDSAKVESTLAALKECAAKELIIIIGIAVLAFATTAGAATQHSSVLRAQVCSRSLTLWTKPVPTRRINALRPFRDECVPFKLVVGWR